MRLVRHRLLAALLGLSSGPAVRLSAQCPDGSPPPCSRASRAVAPSTNSVAVLYFENLGRDTSDAYIAEGLTEEVTARLGQVQRLVVTSRTAVRRLQNAAELQTGALGRALNASYLVSGSVRRAGAQVRVTVELVRASSGARVWGEQFDRGTADLLAIQEDIARAVATGIAGQLLPAERGSLAARPTRNAEAYDHYLRGLRALNATTPVTAGVAIRENEAALRIDSAFGAARASLALAYANAVNWAYESPDLPASELLLRATRTSERALRENPYSSQAWLARGVLLLFTRPQTFEGAGDALARAIALDPDNALAYHWLAITRRRLGDFDGARSLYERAATLDPTMPLAVADRGFIAYQLRHYAEARAWYDSAWAIDNRAWQNLDFATLISWNLGDTARALHDARLAFGQAEGQVFAILTLAQIEGLSGDVATGRARLEPVVARLEAMDSVGVRDGFEAVLALLGTGQRERALRMLERTRPLGPWLWSYLVFPGFDSVRHDPRFERIYAESVPPNAPRLPLP